jgi:hypothetical protein
MLICVFTLLFIALHPPNIIFIYTSKGKGIDLGRSLECNGVLGIGMLLVMVATYLPTEQYIYQFLPR